MTVTLMTVTRSARFSRYNEHVWIHLALGKVESIDAEDGTIEVSWYKSKGYLGKFTKDRGNKTQPPLDDVVLSSWTVNGSRHKVNLVSGKLDDHTVAALKDTPQALFEFYDTAEHCKQTGRWVQETRWGDGLVNATVEAEALRATCQQGKWWLVPSPLTSSFQGMPLCTGWILWTVMWASTSTMKW